MATAAGGCRRGGSAGRLISEWDQGSPRALVPRGFDERAKGNDHSSLGFRFINISVCFSKYHVPFSVRWELSTGLEI